MHQLKALVWKSYKVRLRSPLSTFVDVAGPILVIISYLVIKYILSIYSTPDAASRGTESLFRNLPNAPLDPRQDLSRHICPNVLYYSPNQSPAVAQAIREHCGLNLIQVLDREDALRQIQTSLNDRAKYKPNQRVNMNRLNSTSSCLTLPNHNKTIYQTALFLQSPTSIQILNTEITTSRVVYQPYSQGSTYMETRNPSSDVNIGLHLLDICLRNALRSTLSRGKRQTNTTQASVDITTSPPVNPSTEVVRPSDVQWRLKAYPVLSSSIILHIIYILFQLSALLCNASMTLLRAAEANETGLHHHIRLAGVPAGIYWLSQLIVIFIQMTVQSLIMAALLAIPVTNVLYDPIYETSLTMRWILILSYSLSINLNAMFTGFLFDKASYALIASFMIGVNYSMYPMIFMQQFTPYGFSTFFPINILVLLNPPGNFQALLLVIAGIGSQTGQALNFSQLNLRIINGGINNWTVGELWLLLVAQAVFWLLLTILIDLFSYRSTNNIFGLPLASMNEFCCCNCLGPQTNPSRDNIKTKTMKSVLSKKDPNRICCSLRNLSATGPTISVAHTRDDPLKMTNEQRRRLKMQHDAVSKAGRFLVNRTNPPGGFINPAFVPSTDSPIVLDDAIQQNIIWKDTVVALENLNLDFRFNQVSFILGQTNLKDLLFAALLGVRPISSGYVMLDGTKYTPMTIGLARPQIGFLGENDIFLNELSVFENLQFFGSLRESSYTGYDTESLYVLSLLHLTSRRDNPPSALTSRSARKLALAVAAVGFTKLLLLVEPTLNLRWRPRCQVLNLLKKYRSIRSIVVDTSDIDEATAFGDRIVLLNDTEVDLDGTPDRLRRKLCCGYWLVFEATNNDVKPISQVSIKSLELYSDKLFRGDKLGKLVITKRSNNLGSLAGASASDASLISLRTSKTELARMHRTVVILKIKVSPSSTEVFCELLKKFSSQNAFGLALTDITFESLEDIIVNRMSKAIYPHLPPDLLLSLQHRTKQLTVKYQDSPPVSVRRISSDINIPKKPSDSISATLNRIIQDRLLSCSEMLNGFSLILLALVIMLIAMIGLTIAINKGMEANHMIDYFGASNDLSEHILKHSDIERILKYRTGFYILGDISNETKALINSWTGNKRLTGIIGSNENKSDFKIVTDNLLKSQDLLTSMIFYKPETSEATIVYEPHAPHALLSGITYFHNFHDTTITKRISIEQVPLISQFAFSQPWHEMIWGYFSRRFIYGLGFAIAEGVSIGMFVLAPVRHRSESPLSKMSSSYWFSLGLCDLSLSIVVVIGYIVLIVLFEGFVKMQTLVVLFLVLIIYKLASLPVAYLVSFTAETSRRAFLSVLLIYFTTGWIFAIHLRSLVEWTLIDQGYLYAIAMWIILVFPVGALVDLVVNILHMNRMQQLCGQVPAYTATSNLTPLDGVERQTIVDKLINKVRECLNSGKTEVTYNILHERYFGILWNIYMICFFGILAWTFLLTSERFFGLIARRFSSARLSADPLKTLVRYSESRTYKWDREKDRLVSEYIRCMSETKYVESMTKNCIFLRIWLKPMGDQNLLDKHMSTVLEPLYSLGQPRSEVQLELKTTLQVFVRVGTETTRYKVDKIQLIEAYSRYIKTHSGSVLNFAVVDWSREALYKILLHGHYNIKATSFFD